MWLFSIVMILILVFVGVINGLTPKFSRQATPFGVAVNGKHDYVEERKNNYLKWNIIGSILLALPLFIFPFMENVSAAELFASMYITFALLIFMAYSILLYFKYRKEIKEWRNDLPEDKRSKTRKVVVDLNYHNKIQSKSNWSFLLWQAVIILIPVVIAFSFYDRIPNEIPINWDAQFNVNRTMSKSIWTVLALPGIQVLMIPVLIYSNYSIIKSKQRLSPLDPEDASEKSLQFRQAWSNFTFAMTIGTQLLMSSMFLYSLFSQGKYGWIIVGIVAIFLIFTLGGTVYLSLKYGQGGEKLLTEEEQYYADPDDEDLWKLGMIYYNPEDPSIFVEKRFGVGPTLNMARWQAWAFSGGMVLFTILLIVWSYTLT